MDRRTVLRGAGVIAATVGVQSLLPSRAGAEAGTYFHHGVASGDPLPDSVLLWTRVTPTDSAVPGSGTGPDVSVVWEVASDRAFQRVVARGEAETGPGRDHTVKVDARGLRPGTPYFYRFSFDGKTSPVGRTKTAPAAHAEVDRLRIAVASCANFEGGYFAAYRHLAAEDPDLVVFLGDYIYEYKQRQYGIHQLPKNQLYNEKLFDSRFHEPAHEVYTLADYRMRYAQYRRDPDLQRAHQELPWFITWDDHDVADNSWSGGSEGSAGWPGTPPAMWPARKQAAFQAFAEWMPVRDIWKAPLYRSLRWGTLAEIPMLDLRSYRTKTPETRAQADAPSATITGSAQMKWLENTLAGSKDAGTRWRVIGNPVVFSPHFAGPTKRLSHVA